MPNSEVDSGFEQQILEEAIRSPAVAMMRLSLEVDRQLRIILAVIGRLREYTGQSPIEALDFIGRGIEGSAVPVELRDTVKIFWELRNHVVHGSGSNQGFAMRALDYGFRILRMIQNIPRPAYIIFDVVPVFSDKDCGVTRLDVRGVIMDSFGSKGEKLGRYIYPSRKEYLQGQSVTWEWDLRGPGWNDTWYREPPFGTIRSAWSSALEFVGRSLELI